MAPLVSAAEHVLLLDWRRRVADLYATVRADADPERAWTAWRAGRERLFLDHPCSPLPTDGRTRDRVPHYFAYDPALRVHASVSDTPADEASVPTSDGGAATVRRAGEVRFALDGEELSLAMHWLTDYAGGLLITFRDATCGRETYGSGRYLLDTAKGADLGAAGGALIVDFNFAYQPSCSYDATWSCPLPPRENWLGAAVRAGERLSAPADGARH